LKIELLRMDNISKAFSGVEVLSNVNINVYKGEVLALIGENGAGKSTLIKILSGIYPKNGGTIYLNEKEVEIRSPQESQRKGIVCIHQELKLVPDLTISENILMANGFQGNSFIIDKEKAYNNSKRLLSEVELQLDPDTKISSLTMGQKYLVEVAKALSVNAQLIVMDETTASLTDKEIKILKGIINKLRENQASIIFVSHKLDEVLDIADRITVLRDGNTVGTLLKDECTKDKLIKLMIGKEYRDFIPKSSVQIGKEIFRAEHISTGNIVKDVSFKVRAGEILGITGLIGSGKSELANIIFGINPKYTGEIFINGKKVKIKNPKDAIRNRLGLIPEDRLLQGLVLDMTVSENIVMSILKKISSMGCISFDVQNFVSKEYISNLNIKAKSEHQHVFQLSSGNQQKVLISRLLSINPKVLIMDEPTRGLDIISKKQIYELIYKLSQEGIASILISTDLKEILSLSNRILVMKDGKIVGELSREEANQKKIMHLSLS
jgi:ribose transport system ATP-binding protein